MWDVTVCDCRVLHSSDEGTNIPEKCILEESKCFCLMLYMCLDEPHVERVDDKEL